VDSTACRIEREIGYHTGDQMSYHKHPHPWTKGVASEARAVGSMTLRARDVAELIGLSSSRIYQLIAVGKFPKQTRCPGGNYFGGSAVWSKSEVEQWIAEREALNGAQENK